MAKTTSRVSRSTVPALSVYPVPGTKRTIEKLGTVAMTFTREQAVQLATRLLIASEAEKKVTVTGFRLRRRPVVSVTSPGRKA